MRSLFLRIFLLFWLAMALVAATLVITSPFFTRSRPALERWHIDAESSARSRVERVTHHIAERGIDEYRPDRDHSGGRKGGSHGPARVFVLDENGVGYRGQEAPPEVRDLALRSLASGLEQTERTGTLYMVGSPVIDPDGRRLAVVVAHHSPPRLVHLLEPSALGWRLAILVLVVGGLSFWLARYLSSPVGPLRRATRRLSTGDLGARVGKTVGRRRDEIGQLARDFDAMAERIESLVGSQKRLLRDVSHELRSPLARLVVALELARSRAGEDAAGFLDRIEREAVRLDELIGRLLLLERLEAGEPDGQETMLDIEAILDEVVADAEFEAAPVDCEVHLVSNGPLVVDGRPDLLRSAFENIIRNALRHTPEGSTVEVEARETDSAFEITVRDHGPGIATEAIDKIFEPFFRVDEARDRSSGGVGLGLAIAARAVRVHGGTIVADNHPAGGLVVTVRLPRPAK